MANNMWNNADNMSNSVASANRVVCAVSPARAYATAGATAVNEVTTFWLHTPVTGFAKKRQRPKDPLL